MKNRIGDFSGYVPGVGFVILGLLVVFFPMLLVGLFSAVLILMGVTAIAIAHRLRKWRRIPDWTMDWDNVGPLEGEGLQRVFIYRRF
jgi:hypothetical protein